MQTRVSCVAAFMFFSSSFVSSFVLRDRRPPQTSDDIFGSFSRRPVYLDVFLPPFHLEDEPNDLGRGENTSADEGPEIYGTSKSTSDTDEGIPSKVRAAFPSSYDKQAGTVAAPFERRDRSSLTSTVDDVTQKNIINDPTTPRYRLQPRRRGLADPGLTLGLPQYDPWRVGTGINYSKMPGGDTGVDGSYGDEVYTYMFVGERFKLNGSANINFDGVDKFRITFKFSISGDGNATAELVTPEQEVKVPTWNGNEVTNNDFLSRPDSCHLQATENVTTRSKCEVKGDRKPTKQKTLAPRRAISGNDFGSFPFFRNKYSLMSSSMTSQYGQSMSDSFIFPTSDETIPVPAKSDNGDCDVTRTTYVRKWLCIGRTSPPCFMVLMQGSKYRVAERICPRRFSGRRTFRQLTA